jgi:hypothetical protein
MTLQLYHRTTVSEARAIVQEGFQDEKWSFGADEHTGEPLLAVGVWLTDRPVTSEDGPPGPALLEVALELPEETLRAFEIGGVFEETRLWVIPAPLVNRNAAIRIGEVDARSSWFHEQVEEEEPED